MTGKIEQRLQQLGIELPEAPAAVSNYMPYVVSGNQVYVSGQVTIWQGERRYQGKRGRDLDAEEGRAAARICGLNLIGQARNACGGDLDRIRQVIKLTAFVNCTEAFTDLSTVINGASDLMVEVFGDAGRCTRMNGGVASLPFGFAVEIDGLFEIE